MMHGMRKQQELPIKIKICKRLPAVLFKVLLSIFDYLPGLK